MFNIYSHIWGKTDPTCHRLTRAYTFSCEQLQPGIWKMAVERVFGVTVAQRASQLNVARCSQITKINKYVRVCVCGRLTLGRAEVNFSVFLLLLLSRVK